MNYCLQQYMLIVKKKVNFSVLIYCLFKCGLKCYRFVLYYKMTIHYIKRSVSKNTFSLRTFDVPLYKGCDHMFLR